MYPLALFPQNGPLVCPSPRHNLSGIRTQLSCLPSLFFSKIAAATQMLLAGSFTARLVPRQQEADLEGALAAPLPQLEPDSPPRQEHRNLGFHGDPLTALISWSGWTQPICFLDLACQLSVRVLCSSQVLTFVSPDLCQC